MQKYQNNVTDRFGNAVQGVQVLVNVHGGGAASIYSDNGVTPAANPMVTDSKGRFEFYAADARYDIIVSGEDYDDTMIVDTVALSTSNGGKVSASDLAAPTGSSLVGFLQSGVGAVARTVQSKNRDVVSVRDFGATGDGVTNDLAAFQAAVDHLFSIGGGTLYAPRGTYVINNSINWKDKVSLVGDGPGKTIIKMVGTLFSAILNTSQGPAGGGDPNVLPLTDITFANFEIDGSGLTSTASSVGGKGMFILYMRRATFFNLYIHHCIGTGLGCDFLDDTLILGVVANNNGRNWDGSVQGGQSGIGIGTGWRTTESVTVMGCHTSNNGNYGVFVETQQVPGVYYSEGARVVGCYAESNRIGFGNKGSGGTTFDACQARNSTAYGFALSQQSRGDVLTGCVATGSAQHGFFIADHAGPVRMSNCVATGNTLAGVRASITGANPMNGIFINGGVFSNNGQQGIVLAGLTPGITSYSIVGASIKDNGQSLTAGQRQGVSMSGAVNDGLIADNWIGNSPSLATQSDAVQSTGATDTLTIQNNTVKRHASGPFTITTPTDVVIQNNHGYNFQNAAAIVSPGASPWTFTAGTSNTQLMLSGTGISVSMGGQTLFDTSTQADVTVPANGSVIVTYSTITRARTQRL